MHRIPLVVAIASAACATTFTGSPKVTHGAAGCRAICTSYGMELAGMVALGEYSDGCICEVAGKHASSAGAAGAAAAAVMVDMANRSQQASDVAPPHP